MFNKIRVIAVRAWNQLQAEIYFWVYAGHDIDEKEHDDWRNW